MDFWDIFFMGIGLAADAFAAAVCRGVAMGCLRLSPALQVAGAFGVFQALMPLLGWLSGNALAERIGAAGRWVAFFLLAFIGAKTVYGALHPKNEEKALQGKTLLLVSLATSIDALAAGVTVSLKGDTDILYACAVIGLVTFILCLGGVAVGHYFGARFKEKAEIAGGTVLIGIAIKLLLHGA